MALRPSLTLLQRVYHWERSSCYLSCTIIYKRNLFHCVCLALSDQQEIVVTQQGTSQPHTDIDHMSVYVMMTFQDMPLACALSHLLLVIALNVGGQLCPLWYVGPCLQWEVRSRRGQSWPLC